MENYKRGKRVEEEFDRYNLPIPNLPEDFTWMQVSAGSRMRNLLYYAMNSMNRGKQVVWTGTGSTLGKAISCAEILKRKFKAHQITKICYKKIEEHWEPIIPGLEAIIVTREIPTIHILISREELDVNEPGYQSPVNYKGYWRPSFPQCSSTQVDSNPFRAKRRAEFLKQLTSKNK